MACACVVDFRGLRTAHRYGKTMHPHPTLGESVEIAAEIVHSICTDVPPRGRRCLLERFDPFMQLQTPVDCC